MIEAGIPPPGFRLRRLGRTEVRLTELGLGSACLGNLYRVISDDVAMETLAAGQLAEIGYVDTAPHYGHGLAERRIGKFLKDSDGTRIPILSSKVGRVLLPVNRPEAGTNRHGFVDGDPFEPVFDYSYDGVMRSFAESLHRLGRDRIDILLAHDLGRLTHGADHDQHLKAFLDGGYKAMCKLKDQGLVSAIGLGVNECEICEDILNYADFDTFLLAGRYTLLEQGALDRLLPACEQRQISVILGGPFNSGILVEGTTPGTMSHYNYSAAPPEIVRRVVEIEAVCASHGVRMAAAALQFPLGHPTVASVIPGMASPQHVRVARELYNTRVPQALWDDLKSAQLIHPNAPAPQPLALAAHP